MSPSLEIVVPHRVTRVEKSAVPAPRAGDDSSHAAGFSAGYEAGRLRAEWEGGRQREKERARIRTLAAKLENLNCEYERLLEEHLPDLIQGALGRIFCQHPFTAAEISGEVIALLRDMQEAGRITLECAPAEADELRRDLEACETIPNNSRWTLQGNPSLASGEFLLKSDLGDVDGRHSSRIRQIHLAAQESTL
jgi:flagellar biosynthesis/type III secretory pathway protein FliH